MEFRGFTVEFKKIAKLKYHEKCTELDRYIKIPRKMVGNRKFLVKMHQKIRAFRMPRNLVLSK